MKWTYLLVYSPTAGSYDKIKQFLEDEPAILNWLVYIPHTVLIVSDQTAKTLSELFRASFPNARFLILDTHTDRNGWLPQKAWELMKQPKAIWED